MKAFHFRSFPRKWESSAGSRWSLCSGRRSRTRVRGRAGGIAIALALCLLAVGAPAAQNTASQYPILADEGDPIANHGVAPELAAQIEKLPGIIATGNPNGDVTLFQFYDLNCPFCREAARDVDALLRADPALKMIFIPYPVLSQQSLEAARVELAVAGMVAPQRYLEFRRKIYAGRGIIDSARALAAAEALGLDRRNVLDAANAPQVLEKLKAYAALASALKVATTPAYVIHGVVIQGHPGLEPLQKIARSVRSCGAVVC